jgi:hypothetical protein
MHHGDVSPDIAQGLLALKKRIAAAKIPPSKLDETINVAVWNIREFGRKRRTKAAIHLIAEILGQFDLIAMVELRNDLADLGEVIQFLGPSWDIVYSDWIDDRGGNDERIAFLFDRRAVTFNGLAAEVDAPRDKEGSEYLATLSFWRAPYMCSFRAGNFDFIVIAAHTRWGANDIAGRRAELQLLADWIEDRFIKGKFAEDNDLIVMGDFNTPKIGDELYKALTSKKLQIPDALEQLRAGDQIIGGSNLGRNARYDQILCLPSAKKRFKNVAGVLDFYGSEAQRKELFPGKSYSREQFTYQLSDHFPLWTQIDTDIDGERLTQIVQNSKKT